MTGEDEPIAATALDSNFAELIRWYASRPGGEVVEGGDVTLCSTGLAFRSINCAVEIDLAPATADRRIAEVGEMDLGDPEARFAAQLQLRIIPDLLARQT